MDPDKVELSNLSRQPLYTEDDVGSLKVNAAKNVLSHINPNAVIKYSASDMILRLDSDAAYLVAPEARSRAGGYHWVATVRIRNLTVLYTS